MGEVFITRRGGSSTNKSMIFVTAPEGTESVTATYGEKTIRGMFKNGKWVFSNLTYGEGVVWKITAKRKTEIATESVPMPMLEIRYIDIQYWKGELFIHGNEFTEITGGWIDAIYPNSNTTHDKLHKNGDTIRMVVANSGVSATTVNGINMDKYKTLHINIVESYMADEGTNRCAGYIKQADTNQIVTRFDPYPAGMKTIDISKLKGNKYRIQIGVWSAVNTPTHTYKLAFDSIYMD